MRSAFGELFRLYRGMGRGRVYLAIRWLISPFQEMERLIPREGTVLDIGCGEGVFANLLALKSPARRVIGLDLSSRRLKIAQATVRDRKGIEFVQQDIRQFHMEQCEAIVMSDFLHHLTYQDQNELLERSWQRLSPRGVLLLKEPASNDGWRYRCTWLWDHLLYRGDPFYFRDSSQLSNFLRHLGFKVNLKRSALHFPGSTNLYVCRKEAAGALAPIR